MTMPSAIVQNETICRSTSVAPSARSIPIAARRFPERAVAGELSCLSPKMKRTAATMYATAIAESRRSSTWFVRRLFLEHLEHPVGDDESAEHVRRAEDDGDESEHMEQRRVGSPGDEHRAEHDDAVNRVGSGHKRRVEHRRNARYHFVSDEDRHDEDVNAEYQLLTHYPVCLRLRRTFPSAVMQTASMMSSPKLRFSLPSGARSATKAVTFLAYIWLAW